MTHPIFSQSLNASGPITQAFSAHQCHTFGHACEHVMALPYGRTSKGLPLEQVLLEGKGTCSSKHALLSALAKEHNWPVQLTLGIYLMNGENTPGIDQDFGQFGITGVPEAHCYLTIDGTRYDFTNDTCLRHPEITFLMEQAIEPQDTLNRKAAIHKEFLNAWIQQNATQLSFDAAWQLREQCIAQLSAIAELENP